MAFDLDDEELKATRILNKVEKKIEVGEYVRTKEGYISKCIEVDEDGDYFTFDNYVEVQYGDKFNSLYDYESNKIIKHSKNIIDLIEEGDYVNGYLVVAKSDDGYIEIAIGDDIEQGELLEQNDIKTIVTKEQMKSMEYKVKE